MATTFDAAWVRLAYRLRRALGWAALLTAPVGNCLAQRDLGFRPTSSGGPLSIDQAAFDVQHYDLSLSVDPPGRSIRGSLEMRAEVALPTRRIVLDLDDPLQVEGVFRSDGAPLAFERPAGRVVIHFPLTLQPGSQVGVRIHYEGQPRVAPRPPWVGGFIWSSTEDGQPWIAVACQMDGADLWWPVKDHPSDEPASMDLRITVPEPLVVAANGTLSQVKGNSDGTRTFHWRISNPINNYSVTLNIAPYREIQDRYQSISGESFPVTFWVLPENYGKGVRLFPQFAKHLRFLEEILGPYPFRDEKYGVAETPYLGMEHQTIIAYGNQYRDLESGYDWLHFHELAHEWWGNLVTASDWKDFWIHEGFASYMEALFLESREGSEALSRNMERIRLRNLQPLAPREPQTTVEKYYLPPDYTSSDGDVNSKASWVVHTLRYVIGDEAFFRLLKRLTYPDGPSGQGCGCHFLETEDVKAIAEEVASQDLDWFFDVYLRQPLLPRLILERQGDQVRLTWSVPDDLPFPMPVTLRIGEELRRLAMAKGSAVITVPSSLEVAADPHSWILRARD